MIVIRIILLVLLNSKLVLNHTVLIFLLSLLSNFVNNNEQKSYIFRVKFRVLYMQYIFSISWSE